MLIGKIRDKMGWLLIVVIGLAMLAFILGDLMGNKGGGPQTGNDVVGVVNDEEITFKYFEDVVNQQVNNMAAQYGQAIDDASRARVRDQVWEQTVMRLTLQKEFDKLGVQVSGEELFDMIQGKDPHPYIKQYFSNPETQQFEREKLLSFLKNINNEGAEQQKKAWKELEEQLILDRLQQKYLALINKGVYVTNFQSEKEASEQNKTIDFRYVVKPYMSISDDKVKVTDADINKYFEENKSKYKQKASRSIEYVVFDVIPSPKDSLELREWFEEIRPDFLATTEVKLFVNSESDIKYNDAFLSKDGLSAFLSPLFDSPVGTTSQIYFEGGFYKMAKVADASMRPDSVKARHILVKSKGNAEANNKFADSLKIAIKEGANFAELAKQHSEDPGSGQKGGELDWFKDGQMVKPFNDACFKGSAGEMVSVESEFGTHLIEILAVGPKSKKVNFAVIARSIEPSDVTYSKAFVKASKFAVSATDAESFDATTQKQNLPKRIADDIKPTNSEIAGLQNARPLVKWAFKASKGDVSGVQELGNKFVIAKLTKIKEDGYADIEDIKEELEAGAIKDKKAEMIIKKMSVSGKDLATISKKMSAPVMEATAATFAGFSLPIIGRDYTVQGTLFAIGKNRMSSPIKGEQGVYVVEVTNSITIPVITKNAAKASLQESSSRRGSYEAINAIKELAEIKDNRGTIY